MDSHPKIIQAEDILAQLRAGVKETHEIVLRSARIPVRILSIDEVNKIRAEAKKLAMISGGDETDQNLQIQKLTLQLATQVPKNTAPILSEKVLALVTLDELTTLFNEYINVMERVNPSIEHIPPEGFRSLVDALKKNAITVKDLSLRQKDAICNSYVDLIQRQENQISPQVS
jgi:hypothetical protein